jgi:hypothetical protein
VAGGGSCLFSASFSFDAIFPFNPNQFYVSITGVDIREPMIAIQPLNE